MGEAEEEVWANSLNSLYGSLSSTEAYAFPHLNQTLDGESIDMKYLEIAKYNYNYTSDYVPNILNNDLEIGDYSYSKVYNFLLDKESVEVHALNDLFLDREELLADLEKVKHNLYFIAVSLIHLKEGKSPEYPVIWDNISKTYKVYNYSTINMFRFLRYCVTCLEKK